MLIALAGGGGCGGLELRVRILAAAGPVVRFISVAGGRPRSAEDALRRGRSYAGLPNDLFEAILERIVWFGRWLIF